MQSRQQAKANFSERSSYPISTVTPLPGAALIGRRVLFVSNGIHHPESILSVLRSLGADSVCAESLSSKRFPGRIPSLISSILKSDLVIYSMTGTRPELFSFLFLFAVTVVAKLSQRKVVFHFPDLLYSLLSGWQRTLVKNATSVSTGILFSDSRQVDHGRACTRPVHVVSSLQTISSTSSGVRTGSVQPSILALASSPEEEDLLRRVLVMTRQKYPRVELKISSTSRLDAYQSMNTCDVALILSPSAFRLDFVQSALSKGLIPILPHGDLPGMEPGSGLALSIQPLDVPQAVTALCRLVEEPELVTTLRANGARFVKSLSPQVVQESWGVALGAILAAN